MYVAVSHSESRIKKLNLSRNTILVIKEISLIKYKQYWNLFRINLSIFVINNLSPESCGTIWLADSHPS